MTQYHLDAAKTERQPDFQSRRDPAQLGWALVGVGGVYEVVAATTPVPNGVGLPIAAIGLCITRLFAAERAPNDRTYPFSVQVWPHGFASKGLEPKNASEVPAGAAPFLDLLQGKTELTSVHPTDTDNGHALAVIKSDQLPVSKGWVMGVAARWFTLAVVSRLPSGAVTAETHTMQWNVNEAAGVALRRRPVMGCAQTCARYLMQGEAVIRFPANNPESGVTERHDEAVVGLNEVASRFTDPKFADVFGTSATAFTEAQRVLRHHELISPVAKEAFQIFRPATA